MRDYRRSIAIITLALVVFTPPVSASIIVFDPTNFGVNLEQVVHHLEIIARLDRQIRNQLRMLENWQFTRLRELLAAMTHVRGTVEGVAGIDLGGRYPTSAGAYASRDPAAMSDLRREWLASQRGAVLQARTTQNTVVGEMPATQKRIGEYLNRSRRAPGQTAVLQAGNETLATLAAQLQSLQALELSATRVELEVQAQSQAEATFHRQAWERLMRDWPSTDRLPPGAQTPVRSPFGRR